MCVVVCAPLVVRQCPWHAAAEHGKRTAARYVMCFHALERPMHVFVTKTRRLLAVAVGTIKLSQVPSFNASDAPARLAPTKSYQRRLDNHPASSDLSQTALERLWKPQPANTSSSGTPAAGGRHLLAQDKPHARSHIQQRPHAAGRHQRPQRSAGARTSSRNTAGARKQPAAAAGITPGRQLLAAPLVTPKVSRSELG